MAVNPEAEKGAPAAGPGRKPSPGWALFLSLAVYPGSGQAMNQRWPKAAAFACAFSLALGVFLWRVGVGLWGFYRALTDLGEPIPLTQALGPALWPGVATLVFYLGAALEAWLEARRLASQGPPPPQSGPGQVPSGPSGGPEGF